MLLGAVLVGVAIQDGSEEERFCEPGDVHLLPAEEQTEIMESSCRSDAPMAPGFVLMAPFVVAGATWLALTAAGRVRNPEDEGP
ncbi:MAG: hypothetical protein U5R31_09780 [Acidimicrobiia bacterium]|nr:hypothetical protein [Acidimicrobiia bacterium]